ncbi:MAG: T9SS type A sorting domain-containing protein [Bacteroidales bacterium]|nr:T9SS type A sorting domain-containing protein [Bacteroidales bacterium]MCF8387848.1 T9SS type A sorting domain-containing protein [Bacteroidales bacterium]MCF8397346.1 T9SS type A sorting domain-containing protein [Bacteroidales bacterium]
MKRILLIVMALSLGTFTFAQSQQIKPMSMDAPKTQIIENVVEKASPITSANEQKPSQVYSVNGRDLTFVNIGSSGNAYGFYSDPRTYLWADNNINSVVFTHRMVADPPTSYGTSRLAYDVSWEGGADGTWTNDIQVYDPTGPGSQYPDDAGRYPQGAIVNPMGNTDPAAAYYTYFAPTLSSTNDAWGGYGYGINALTAVDPASPTQHNDTDVPPYRLIPDAFTITQTGVAWMADVSYDVPTDTYQGAYIFYKGEINEAGDDIEYESWTMDVLEEGDGINDTKIGFDPSGQIGYLCVMSEAASDPTPYTSYHPILYETTDGGETWSDEPINCQFGGPDGIDAVKNYLPDEILDAIFGEGAWDRETVAYNMGFHTGMAVDYMGNAHFTGLITPASDDGWYPNPDVMGTFHVWYNRDTEEWDANLLYMNRTFDGAFGDIAQYNRPYISSDMGGRFLFFSWLDTDQEGIEENVSPDIYLVSYDLQSGEYSEVQNVTTFTQAMWTAYWGSQSNYVFEEYVNDDTEIQFTIPFVYEEADPNDPTAPVSFWYMDGYTMTFPNYWLGAEEGEESLIAGVKQNYPNPFSTTTSIEVSLEKASDLSLEVVNLIGQKVLELNKGQVEAGNHKFEISAEGLVKGVYFYTVKSGNNHITKKMIVE